MKRRKALRHCKSHGDLYEAVAQYVEKRGGAVSIIGGVELLEEDPPRRPETYRVAVVCVGKRPNFDLEPKKKKQCRKKH